MTVVTVEELRRWFDELTERSAFATSGCAVRYVPEYVGASLWAWTTWLARAVSFVKRTSPPPRSGL